MKHLSRIAPLLLAVLAGGCGTINQTEYFVAGSGKGENTSALITAADREAVKELLRPIAAQFKLQDMTTTSLIPNTIVYYQEQDTEHPLKISAREDRQMIIVDIMHYPPTVGETLRYRTARDTVLAQLRNRFPNRVSVVPFRTAVPGAPSTPPQ